MADFKSPTEMINVGIYECVIQSLAWDQHLFYECFYRFKLPSLSDNCDISITDELW